MMNGSRKEMERLMTVKELSEHLSIAPKTLYNWLAAGKIPYVKMGGAVRFRPSDIAAFVEKNAYVPKR